MTAEGWRVESGCARGPVLFGRRVLVGLTLLTAFHGVSCTVGSGEGSVESERLLAPNCHDGPYTMEPNFFSSEAFENTQLLRIQKGNSPQTNSDALIVVVHDVRTVLDRLGEPVPVHLPIESVPEDVSQTFSEEPVLVTLALHLGETCAEEVITLQGLSGTITFEHLYDGDSKKKDERLISASFEVEVADPRSLEPDPTRESGYSSPDASVLTGSFRFHHRRGIAAQPFP